MTISTADLDAIRKRATAAFPGPWTVVTDSCDCGDTYGCSHGEFPYAIRLPGHKLGYADKPCDPTDPCDSYRHHASDISDLTMETAEFITHARADVPALLAEVERLRRELDTMERSDDARLEILTAWSADAADVIRDLLRLSAVPADPPDEAIVRQRAEALLAKIPPRPVLATGNDTTEARRG